MIQPWLCEKCKQIGKVVYAKGDDVWSVLNRLETSHRSTSPRCTGKVSKLRVGSEKELQQLNRLDKLRERFIRPASEFPETKTRKRERLRRPR